jgi:hypothetical protein
MDGRSDRCKAKLERMALTLAHREADRVPISDFFWSSFISRWQQELGLPKDASPYVYYDLDWVATVPNMDPHIKPFEVIKQSPDDIILKTGFEAVIRHKEGIQMPYFEHFETDTIEKALAFRFDDPWDDRRYVAGGDNQIAGIGDVIVRNTPPWIDSVKSLHPDFPVYGSVCEVMEEGWRIIGSENMLMWLALYPDEMQVFLDRVGDFIVGLTEAQIKAAGGMLDGMVVWGDVAYVNGMLFSPDMWRTFFKPHLKRIIDVCHAAHLPVVYHGCGNAKAIYADMHELGLDAYNPLEAKSGLDVVELRKEYGHDIFAFCGNIDARNWGYGSDQEVTDEVMRKLNAAKGGGYIVQSDHSVPSNVSAERFELVYNLVKKHGSYPLQLGAYDIPELG